MGLNNCIELKGIRYSYPKKRKTKNIEILKGIDLSVNSGEIFGFLGPNGSGKTTLFKILSTLIAPTSGSVSVFGHLEVSRVRSFIGTVFQHPSLDKKLTVEENLRHQGHLYGMKGASLKKIISTQIEKFDLTDRTKEMVETLSGGLRRRVELAKGLMHNPKLLLLDEPSTGLDPAARRSLWDIFTNLSKKEGVTLLLTTHLAEEAEQCDRLAIMNEGTLVAKGTPVELKKQIGGDVITVNTSNPNWVAKKIRDRFGINSLIINDKVRIEQSRGHEFIRQIVEEFPDKVSSVTLGKPTLEDVFVKKTGKAFW